MARSRRATSSTSGAPPRAAAPPPAPSRVLVACLIAGLALFLAHAWWFRDFVIDDAFISYRYARNLAAGLGPVFNPGARVEGFSNPLFTALLALPARLLPGPDALPLVARTIGVLAGACCLGLLARLRWAGGTPAAALAILLTATSTGFALWSVAGLETTLHALLVLAAVATAASPPRSPRGQFGAGLLLAALALSRPEGALLAATLFAMRWSERSTRGDVAGHLRVALAAALPSLGYLGFRLLYYGAWLPNPYFAKHIPLAMAPGLGLRYLAGFVAANGGALLHLPALAALLPRPRSRTVAVALATVLAQAAFILIVGGDWMDQHRFVVPVLAPLYLLVGEGWATLLSWVREGRERRVLAPLTVLAVWALLLAPSVASSRRERAVYWVNARPYYETVGRLTAAVADPGWTVAVDDIGAIGWYGGIRVLDLIGLTEPDLARRRTWAEALIGARAPELVVLHVDERVPPRARWRALRIQDFDSIWVAPRAAVPVPASVRVRADVRERVEWRLAHLEPRLRGALVDLDRFLATRQPDGRPLPPGVAR